MSSFKVQKGAAVCLLRSNLAEVVARCCDRLDRSANSFQAMHADADLKKDLKAKLQRLVEEERCDPVDGFFPSLNKPDILDTSKEG